MNEPTGPVREQEVSNDAAGGAVPAKVDDPPTRSGPPSGGLPAVPASRPLSGENEEAKAKARERKLQVWTFWSQVGILAVTAVGIGVALYALDVYKAQNRVAARAQLYGTEQTIALREIEKPECSFLYSDFDSAEEEEARTKLMVGMISADEHFTGATDAAELYDRIWGVESFKFLTESIGSTADDIKARKEARLKELQRVRMVYLHAESYLYHLHNAWDYRKEKVIHDQEWETWVGMLDAAGSHPLFLAAIYSAEKNKYFSRGFAHELRRRLLNQAPQVEPREEKDPSDLKEFDMQSVPSLRKRLADLARREAADAKKEEAKRARNARYVAYMLPQITQTKWIRQFTSY